MPSRDRAGGALLSVVRVVVALWVSFLLVSLAGSAFESAAGVDLPAFFLPVATVLLATGLLTVTSDAW